MIFSTYAIGLKPSERLVMLGNCYALGNWNITAAAPMSYHGKGRWIKHIKNSALSFPLEYKICLQNIDTGYISWEEGENRRMYEPTASDKSYVEEYPIRLDYQKLRIAGTAIPVFSLRSRKSCGIGDFGDLRLLIDWLKATSQKVLQILPVNDTTQTFTRRDSYPYNAISIYALHPIYLNLKKMGKLNDDKRAHYFTQQAKILNSLEKIDYERTAELKRSFFKEIFAQDGDKTLKSNAFLSFYESNREWLIPYSAYSFLRDKYGVSDFSKWENYSKFDLKTAEHLCSEYSETYKETAYYMYLQFHLHRQLLAASRYAAANGIILKGDIPIGISRTSVEAWTEPDLFNLDCQTGAPPDFFSPTGQNWGFPTYNWNEMKKTGYRWWIKRFRKMEDYFTAFRIDHILGFFRIWEIPKHSVQGLLGQFYPALPFTEEEIRSFGFDFQPDTMLNPRIHERFLPELFGDKTSEIVETFLEKTDDSHFTLKKKYSTQAKIAKLGKKYSNELFALTNEALFLRDRENPNLFHPRIAADATFRFRELSEEQQNIFRYLSWDFFYRRCDEFWKQQALSKLSHLVASTDMLACGEDLGMIPNSVPEVMNKLKILSLEIERMPKKMDTEFTNLQQLDYLSVCTTSTHDLSPLRLWWAEDREKTQRYYNEVLHREGEAPKECSPEIIAQILHNHLNINSMLTIIPLQDWLALDKRYHAKNDRDERINIPSNPHHYWRYRICPTIEALLEATELNNRIVELINKSGRGN